ncbi:hypothetical protein BGX34_003526, partial [Mortierella sp. NVP85]
MASDHHVDLASDGVGTVATFAAVAAGLGLEQDLGLDIQAHGSMDLFFPSTNLTLPLPDEVAPDTIFSIQRYIITALCYLARHIDTDLLSTGQDTLTSLESSQRTTALCQGYTEWQYHPHELDQSPKGLGDKDSSAASTLPEACSPLGSEQDSDKVEDEEDEEEILSSSEHGMLHPSSAPDDRSGRHCASERTVAR